MSRFTYFLFGILLVWGVVGMVAAGEYRNGTLAANPLGSFWNRANPSPAPSSPVPLYRPAVDYEQAVVGAVERAAPAVISIIITKDLPVIENCAVDPFSDLPPQFKQFFGPFEIQGQCERGKKKQEVGGGSGFIISKDGLVLTNKHVVADPDAEYTVLTNDSKKYNAKVLARDPVQDLAVVQINSPPASLPVLALGNSDTIKLGQTAIAIGNALGEFRNTVSVGIISGLARTITAEGGGATETLEGLIQTDAAINPGNSGGPLLNLRGEVVGIDTAIAQGAQNIGFAIPINKAKRDIESVKRSGKISTPYLGVRYVNVTEDLATRDNLPVHEGALVRGNDDGPGVIPHSPADKGGVLSEDIILEVNGEKITSVASLGALINQHTVGEAITLKVLRGGKTLLLSVVLGERPAE